jgi:bacterioferritin
MVGEDVPEILDCDLKSERGAQAAVKVGIAHCETVRDYISREILEASSRTPRSTSTTSKRRST